MNNNPYLITLGINMLLILFFSARNAAGINNKLKYPGMDQCGKVVRNKEKKSINPIIGNPVSNKNAAICLSIKLFFLINKKIDAQISTNTKGFK